MKRRSFVKAAALSSAAAVILPAMTTNKATAAPKVAQQFYELRIYTLETAEQQTIVEHYYQEAAIPALNRLGLSPVGVFTALKAADDKRLFVLIPYTSAGQYHSVSASLEHDTTYRQQAAAYLNTPASSPAYQRLESSLLQAFTHWPKLTAPEPKPRIFELRQYQSASEAAGKKKIDMFNDKGEAALFNRLGFKPVFFAETLIGPLRPNLTYMVTFDDMAAHDAHWKAFGSDPEWKKISSVPEYADALLVSKITSTFIVPTGFSQI